MARRRHHAEVSPLTTWRYGSRERLTEALTLLVLLLVMTPLLRATPPRWWMASVFASAPIIFVARVRTARTLALTALLGVVIAVAYQVFYPQIVSAPIALTYGVGVACIIVAFARITRGAHDDSAESRTALMTAMFPAKAYIGILLLGAAASRTPATFDSALTTVDQALGANLSFLIGGFLAAHNALRLCVIIAYNLLPPAVMLAAAIRWRRLGRSDATSIPLAAAIAAITGVFLYTLVPAAGPAFRWGTRFPFDPPTTADLTTALTPVDVTAFRNAMPSLHFAGALFVAWGTWSLGKGARLFGVAFLVLTFVATLGLGEHYLIDLIVAVPFSLAVEASVRRWPGWRRDLGICTALTTGWLLALRFRPETFAAPWATWAGVVVALLPCLRIGLQQVARRSVVDDGIAVATTPLG